jgi:DNA-directed RNA polymerase sigma subunit (sigma70/sigma32)
MESTATKDCGGKMRSKPKELSKEGLKKRVAWEETERMRNRPDFQLELQDKIKRVEGAARLILSSKEREVFFLRYRLSGNGDHSSNEISLICGLPKDRVRKLIAQATKKVRNYLNDPNRNVVSISRH